MIKPFELPKDLWDALLKPLDGSRPCGRSLLYEPIYDNIREARTHEEDNLPQGIWKRDLKKADWQRVEDLCCQALSGETKDLQIAVWLSEAWLQQYGLQGFLKGLELIRRLTSTFWEGIYPELNKDDPEYRLAPFVWLDDKLLESLNLLAVTLPSDQGGKSYHFEDWQRAQQQDHIKKRTQGTGKAEAPTLSLMALKKSQNLTPTSFYKDMGKNLKKCLEELQILETLIASQEPNYPGFLSHLRTKLQAILAFVDVILKNRPGDLAETTAQEGSAENTPCEKASDLLLRGGKITSREHAYQRLAEAADFLARLEPHSPTPYLVRRAITWGSMSLVDLLQEIVNDPNDYRHIMTLLGQKSKTGPNGTTNNS